MCRQIANGLNPKGYRWKPPCGAKAPKELWLPIDGIGSPNINYLNEHGREYFSCHTQVYHGDDASQAKEIYFDGRNMLQRICAKNYAFNASTTAA